MDHLSGHDRPARPHRVRISVVTRVFFTVLGLGGLAVLGVESYDQFRRTGTTARDLWFALHLPVYGVTACVCIALVRAAFSSADWHTFAPSRDEVPEE